MEIQEFVDLAHKYKEEGYELSISCPRAHAGFELFNLNIALHEDVFHTIRFDCDVSAVRVAIDVEYWINKHKNGEC